MRVLMVEPGKIPYETELAEDLKSTQEAVGGSFDAYCPYKDPIAIVYNDEGKILGLPLNRAIYGENGQMLDIIAGNFFIAGLGEEDFTDLSDTFMQKYAEMFKHPEEFVNLNGRITAVPMPIEEQVQTECRDFGIEYDADNPLCQVFEAITQKTSYDAFKTWALRLPTENPDLQLCERDSKLCISALSPDALKQEYLKFNQMYWLGGERMKCDDPNFTFAVLHTPDMENLNRMLPTYKYADHQYDFDDIGREYNHYLNFDSTLQRAAKYGVDTATFKQFVAKVYPQAMSPEPQEAKKIAHKKNVPCI